MLCSHIAVALLQAIKIEKIKLIRQFTLHFAESRFCIIQQNVAFALRKIPLIVFSKMVIHSSLYLIYFKEYMVKQCIFKPGLSLFAHTFQTSRFIISHDRPDLVRPTTWCSFSAAWSDDTGSGLCVGGDGNTTFIKEKNWHQARSYIHNGQWLKHEAGGFQDRNTSLTVLKWNIQFVYCHYSVTTQQTAAMLTLHFTLAFVY